MNLNFKLREGKEEEFLAALKKYGLFQLTPEGLEYFFEDTPGSSVDRTSACEAEGGKFDSCSGDYV